MKIAFDHVGSGSGPTSSGESGTPVCVFWDSDAHGWSDRGCRLAYTDGERSECECDHLTHFGLLKADAAGGVFGGNGDVTSTKSHVTGFEKSPYFVVEVVTYVAVAVCSIFLVIIILKVRTRRKE